MKQHGDYTPPAMLTYGAGFLGDSFAAEVAKPSTNCPGLPAADASGIVTRATWSRRIALANTVAEPIVRAYEQRFGERMNSRSAAGFTTLLTVAQAIAEATDTRPGSIRKALQQLSVAADATVMPWTGIHFKNGQNTEARVVLQQIIHGQYIDVYPRSLAARRVIWPMVLARR